MANELTTGRSGQTFFTIRSEDNAVIFKANFADGPPIVTEGYAGWTVTSRPKEIGLTEWQGRNPMAIEIPFIIDYWITNDSTPGIDCENEVSNLETLCGVGGHQQPPVCIVDGGGVIPHDYTIYGGHRWVIEQVSWDRGIEQRSATSGRRLRCGGSLTIRQFITAGSMLRKLNSRSRAVLPKTFVVTAEQNTMSKIALLMYGNANLWKVIADANNLRDWRSLKLGQKIKIPPL